MHIQYSGQNSEESGANDRVIDKRAPRLITASSVMVSGRGRIDAGVLELASMALHPQMQNKAQLGAISGSSPAPAPRFWRSGSCRILHSMPSRSATAHPANRFPIANAPSNRFSLATVYQVAAERSLAPVRSQLALARARSWLLEKPADFRTGYR
jgi:hypothetical protein